MARKSNQQQETVQPEIVEGNEQVTVTDDQPVDHFTHIVREGKAKKLSPKTENHVFYEITIHDEENELYIRMTGNQGSGLHSKEQIPLKDIIAVLDVQGDKPFKSSVMKCVFSGQSANNAGFMAACCRGLGLIIQSDKSVFLHVLAPDYEQRRDELLSLVDAETKAK
ncbi:hypothetical protein ABK982_19240 [Vibrio parahaemolyticus]|uniref:hypothetical protein n=1 Tax=Vibrio parahaemolyticus TaxID=670 RepID=UPI00112166A7|nr:hypothetical protein [Vibrio parahaemolyticus]EGR0739330.1 hypothetical protein [Vibrio parahaemolyticus]MEA5334164.1 hypothetical protein [Vibrio parahaemolyticus]TNZ81683.1 hypothetical protein CGK39_19420 [Vibrio parahaemolyticus]TOB19945.1 hypothetical protein CGK12_18135 [Vibrio parahaemolyticus]HBC3397349.1 hypothetical protein [Vibrio parahaemolyticus]